MSTPAVPSFTHLINGFYRLIKHRYGSKSSSRLTKNIVSRCRDAERWKDRRHYVI